MLNINFATIYRQNSDGITYQQKYLMPPKMQVDSLSFQSTLEQLGKQVHSIQNFQRFIKILKLENKKPFILSDYDHAAISSDEFIHILKRLKTPDVPFFLFSNRDIQLFHSADTFGKYSQNFNIIAKNGNQVQLNLQDSPSLQQFIKSWQAKKEYQLTQTPLSKNFIKVAVEPLPLESFAPLETRLIKDLEALGVTIYNNSLKIKMTWKPLLDNFLTFDPTKERIISNKNVYLYYDIEEWVKQNPQLITPTHPHDLTIKNTAIGKKVSISLENLVQYIHHRFKKICQEYLLNDLKDQKVFLQPDPHTASYHVIDSRLKNRPKSEIIKIINDIVQDRQKTYPILLDNFKNNTEVAQEVKKLGGDVMTLNL